MDKYSYPKVLLVTNSSFNGITGTGITLSNLFHGWPSEKLAIIHNDSFKNDSNICIHEYKLSTNEIKFRKSVSIILQLLKKKESFTLNQTNKKNNSSNKIIHYGWKLRKIFGGDEIFYVKKISPQLIEWINQFNPDLLYAHFSCLNDIYFINQILSFINLPLIIHIMDNFLQFQYTKGLFAPFLRIIWNRESTRLLQKSNKRICICNKMARFYEKKYKLDFVSYFNVIDTELWLSYPVNNKINNNKFIIVYSGTINNKNIKNLITMSEVVKELHEEGQNIFFNIYTFPSRLETYQKYFKDKPCLSLSRVLEGDDIIPLLKNSDLLFLPIDFSKESVKRMKFSMFAKIPAYMIAGSPILVYGPSNIASVEYASKSGWAYIVTDKNKNQLKKALIKLIKDKKLRSELSKRAQSLAVKQHDLKKVSQEFKEVLCSVLN